jgi:hypothetical protein
LQGAEGLGRLGVQFLDGRFEAGDLG